MRGVGECRGGCEEVSGGVSGGVGEYLSVFMGRERLYHVKMYHLGACYGVHM